MGHAIGCLASRSVYPVQTPKTSCDAKTTYDVGCSSATVAQQANCSLDQLSRSIKVPLTDHEVFVITKSWKAISRNMTHTGIAMFLRMFETREDVMAMFEQFRSVEKADLGSSRALENHALLVMNALDEAIANMDDAEYLIDMLLTTGKSHRRFDNFSASIFSAIEEPFIMAVHEALGARFSSRVETIYRKTIQFILSTLRTGFEHRDDQLHPSAQHGHSTELESSGTAE